MPPASEPPGASACQGSPGRLAVALATSPPEVPLSPDAAVRDELARLCLLLLATVRPAPERLAIEAGAGAVEQLDRALAARAS